MTEPKEINYKVGIDPVSMGTTVQNLGSLNDAQKTLHEATKSSAAESINMFNQILSILSKASSSSKELQDVFNKIKEINSENAGALKPMLDYLEKSVNSGKDVTTTMSEIKEVSKAVTTSFSEWQNQLRGVQAITSGIKGYVGEIGSAMIDVGNSALKVGEALSSGQPAFLKILDMLFKVVELFNQADKLESSLNRAAWDTAAATSSTAESIGNIKEQIRDVVVDFMEKFKMTHEETLKITAGLQNIGTTMGELKNVSQDVAMRWQIWREITPELQIKMMSDYMKTFGQDANGADQQLGKLLATASNLRDHVKNLDMREFISQAHQMSIKFADMGFEGQKVQETFAGVVLAMKKADENVSLERAKEVTQAMRGYGMDNLAHMAYMGTQYGGMGGADLPSMIGRMTRIGGEKGGLEELGKMQMGMLNEMISAAGGKKGDIDSITGAIRIAQDSGLIPKTTAAGSIEMAKAFASGDLEKAMTLQNQSARELSESGIDTVKQLKDATKIAAESMTEQKKIALATTGMWLFMTGNKEAVKQAKTLGLTGGEELRLSTAEEDFLRRQGYLEKMGKDIRTLSELESDPYLEAPSKESRIMAARERIAETAKKSGLEYTEEEIQGVISSQGINSQGQIVVKFNDLKIPIQQKKVKVP